MGALLGVVHGRRRSREREIMKVSEVDLPRFPSGSGTKLPLLNPSQYRVVLVNLAKSWKSNSIITTEMMAATTTISLQMVSTFRPMMALMTPKKSITEPKKLIYSQQKAKMTITRANGRTYDGRGGMGEVVKVNG